jgi:hypothetical protein
MRKIVAGLFVSVDGVVEAPETWTGPYFSPGGLAAAPGLARRTRPARLPRGRGQRPARVRGERDRDALQLAASETFCSGVMHLSYRPSGR